MHALAHHLRENLREVKDPSSQKSILKLLEVLGLKKSTNKEDDKSDPDKK